MKKFFLFVLTTVLLVLGWYLFIKKFDYQFTMDADNSPGNAYQEVFEWKRFNPDLSQDNISVIQSEAFKDITQKVKSSNNSEVEFYWEFKKKNDSLTEIVLNIKSPKNLLSNRLDIINPFVRSIYIDSIKQHLLSFRQNIKDEQQAFNIQIVDSIVTSPSLSCICHTSEKIPLKGKALEMVRTINILEDYILNKDLKLSGNPFVKVTNWNKKEGLIDFNFCFPVNLTHDLGPNEQLKFREIASSSSLKAIFNGNYRLSHKAWFDLLDKADEKNLNTSGLPLEIFFNNPNVESTPSTSWKAEIYMPLKN